LGFNYAIVLALKKTLLIIIFPVTKFNRIGNKTYSRHCRFTIASLSI